MAQYMTIREAAQAWVNGFNEVPSGVLEKLMQMDSEAVREITPPCVNDTVYIYAGEYGGQTGTITDSREGDESEDIIYTIELNKGGEATLNADQFEVSRDGILPMWSTLWTFGCDIDSEWIERGGLQALADCGFRI